MDTPCSIQAVFLDPLREAAFTKTCVTRAVQEAVPLFCGRFLTDLDFGGVLRRGTLTPWVVLRQYGNSCFVNARPLLADALRAEVGLQEAEAAIRGGTQRIVVLSQILDAVQDGLLCSQDLAALVDARSSHTRVIFTGCSVSLEAAQSLGLSDIVALQTTASFDQVFHGL